jgi:centromeric protein E
VNTYEEMIGVFSIADKNRIMKKTGMNDRSSRSHTMIKIILEKKDVCSVGGAYEIEFSEDESIQVSTLNLVDLAGSDTVIRNSEAQKEGSNINKR